MYDNIELDKYEQSRHSTGDRTKATRNCKNPNQNEKKNTDTKKNCINRICIKMNENHTMIITALNINWHIIAVLSISSDWRDDFERIKYAEMNKYMEQMRRTKTSNFLLNSNKLLLFSSISLNSWFFYLTNVTGE